MADLQNVIIGILLGSALLMGFLTMSEDMKSNYNVTTTQAINTTNFNQTDRIYGMVQQGTQNIIKQDTNEDDASSSMLTGAFGTLRTMFESPKIAQEMIASVVTTVGGGRFIIQVATAIVLIIITFALLRSIFRIG